MSTTPVSSQSYERKVLDNEGEKLAYYGDISNRERTEDEEEKLFVNLSVTEILQGISGTIIAIINDLVSGDIKDLKSLMMVLFRENRMIYIGIVIVFVAFCIYLIDITS